MFLSVKTAQSVHFILGLSVKFGGIVLKLCSRIQRLILSLTVVKKVVIIANNLDKIYNDSSHLKQQMLISSRLH